LISQHNESHPRQDADRLPQAMGMLLKQMSAWVASGAIKYREQMVEGLENAPEAFMGMMVGKSFGKPVVHVSSDALQIQPLQTGCCKERFRTMEKDTEMKILMVLTSHDELGNTGKKTGFWLEEFAAPYYIFHDAGVGITLASPKGGQPPLDPKSDDPTAQTADTARFKQDAGAQQALAQTVKLSSVSAEDFDAVFYPGGHGPLWDLAEDKLSITLIESFHAAGKPVALVCHAPGVLRHVKAEDGSPLVKAKRVTGFSDSEEDAVQLSKIVPFLVEDELKRLGGLYSKGPDWSSFVLTDGNLITGQNPASSAEAARQELKLLADA